MAKQTPLHATHAAAGATFVDFAGFEMPVHYGSIKDEHAAVRSAVGLFDVSHMSNLWVTGADAGQALSCISPKPLAELPEGKGQYTVFLHDDGTILDDTFVFHVPADAPGPDGAGHPRYHVIPNAGRNEDAAACIRAAAEAAGLGDVRVADVTRDWAILALQGPVARDVLAAASDDAGPKFHRIVAMDVAGATCLVSGTGYTGEKGVELYVPAADAPRVWDHLMQAGAALSIRPIGLGARDTLRLEKGYCLAGNEFAGGRTPLEAGLGWLIDWDHDFAARDALIAQRDAGHDRLVGLTQQKGLPRAGYPVTAEGESVGLVTSGTQSPTLGHGIALAYLSPASPAQVGDTVQVDVRGRPRDAVVAAPPFV